MYTEYKLIDFFNLSGVYLNLIKHINKIPSCEGYVPGTITKFVENKTYIHYMGQGTVWYVKKTKKYKLKFVSNKPPRWPRSKLNLNVKQTGYKNDNF